MRAVGASESTYVLRAAGASESTYVMKADYIELLRTCIDDVHKADSLD